MDVLPGNAERAPNCGKGEPVIKTGIAEALPLGHCQPLPLATEASRAVSATDRTLSPLR